VRILGVDLPRPTPDGEPVEQTIVSLDAEGRLAQVRHVASLPAVATAAGEFAGGEPFLLGVNVPVVVPARQARARTVENLIRRRLGFRMPPGGRAALSAGPGGVAGETLMAGLAAAGQPCLPYPDRDRRQPSLAETWPGLTLKALLWETSPLTSSADQVTGESLFRACDPPVYRASLARAKAGWAERAVAMDIALRALGTVDGFDFEPTRKALSQATSDQEVERAGGILDASLIAGTARRYLVSPETCLFMGDRERGYLILPADGLMRRLALSGTGAPRARLFPKASLEERIGEHARLRPIDLLSVPGRPQRTEATFRESPQYEFDNVDEMLWWKHTRHLAGPTLPTEGLHELVVTVDPGTAQLKLLRSRHRTLSFRFDPPTAWRRQVPTRDGKAYRFQVVRAVYETLPASD